MNYRNAIIVLVRSRIFQCFRNVIFLFSKEKTTKDRKISLKDIVQNNDSRILKSVDGCIEVETLPFVDLYLSLAGQSSNSNVYMVSILFLNF